MLGSTLDKLLIAVVLTSATASTLTTILPGARTTLSMASHGAIPRIWARVNPRFQTPVWGTAIYGVLSIVWYVGLTLLSQNVLADSIAALGLAIAFYYGINGYAVPLFYRHQIFQSARKFVFLALFPLLGGIALTWVFAASLDQLYYPANSASGTSWFGVGPPFVIGVGFIVSGVIVMFVAHAFLKRSKPFFARKMETVETMVPWDESPEDLLAGQASRAAGGDHAARRLRLSAGGSAGAGRGRSPARPQACVRWVPRSPAGSGCLDRAAHSGPRGGSAL